MRRRAGRPDLRYQNQYLERDIEAPIRLIRRIDQCGNGAGSPAGHSAAAVRAGASVRKCGIISLAKRRKFSREVPPPFSSRYSTP